jgi:type IV secretion system protein VirD4
VWLGRAHHRRGLRLPVQEHLLVFAPPRTGKTQFLSRAIVHYPGPVLSTTTRPDVFATTSGLRQRVGPVEVFNPQGIGGVPSTFSFDPVEGCEDRSVAIRRADGFANALPGSREMGENQFFENAARSYLRAMFHAAALAGGDMRLVSRWALTGTQGGARDAEIILRQHGAGTWADELAQLRGKAEKTAATNEMVLSQALGFMQDPAVALCALPGPDGSLDLPRFLACRGTLYMIADPAGNDESPLSPVFACLAAEIHHVASMTGQSSRGGRLDPPLFMALDEATQICKVPLDQWLAHSGGKGIQIGTVVHGEAQLARAWGDHGRRVILDTSGCKIVLPGVDDPGTLEMLSRVCGDVAYREHGQEHDTRHPVMTPSMINQLPDGFALIKRGNLRPAVAKIAQARKDPTIRRAQAGGPGRRAADRGRAPGRRDRPGAGHPGRDAEPPLARRPGGAARPPGGRRAGHGPGAGRIRVLPVVRR